MIPRYVLANARGFVVLSVAKVPITLLLTLQFHFLKLDRRLRSWSVLVPAPES